MEGSDGGLFANDVEGSAEMSDKLSPRETESAVLIPEVDQLVELLSLSRARGETYNRLPTKKGGGFWQTGEVEKLQVVAKCVAVEPESGKIVDMATGL